MRPCGLPFAIIILRFCIDSFEIWLVLTSLPALVFRASSRAKPNFRPSGSDASPVGTRGIPQLAGENASYRDDAADLHWALSRCRGHAVTPKLDRTSQTYPITSDHAPGISSPSRAGRWWRRLFRPRTSRAGRRMRHPVRGVLRRATVLCAASRFPGERF